MQSPVQGEIFKTKIMTTAEELKEELAEILNTSITGNPIRDFDEYYSVRMVYNNELNQHQLSDLLIISEELSIRRSGAGISIKMQIRKRDD